MRFRLSIASMMAGILTIAVGFAALRVNSAFSAGVLLMMAIAVLCGSALMSITESGPTRLAWLGCALFGWPCFLLGFAPMANERLGPPRITAMLEEAIPYSNPQLATEIEKFSTPERIQAAGYSEPPGNTTLYAAGLQRYRQSCLCVMTLIFATLGGFLGYDRAIRRGQPEEATARR
jgi:hypothetical protein